MLERKCHDWIGRGQNIFKCSEKHHWKYCDCRRRRFDESLSNVCRRLRNTTYQILQKIRPSILDSKEFIQSILKKENLALFRNVKVIIHLICVACVKVSVESVVERLVSRYEKHFDSSRQPTEQYSLNEMIIAENGPLLHNAGEILERAMSQYWRVANRDGKWHFLRQTEDIHSYILIATLCKCYVNARL